MPHVAAGAGVRRWRRPTPIRSWSARSVGSPAVLVSTAPQAVVIFSDGRARDPAQAESIARSFGRMKVPIHVVPVGEPNVGGDVAIVSMVAPAQVRKHSRVAVQVFVRSFGYTGRRVELKLAAAGPARLERGVGLSSAAPRWSFRTA